MTSRASSSPTTSSALNDTSASRCVSIFLDFLSLTTDRPASCQRCLTADTCFCGFGATSSTACSASTPNPAPLNRLLTLIDGLRGGGSATDSAFFASAGAAAAELPSESSDFTFLTDKHASNMCSSPP